MPVNRTQQRLSPGGRPYTIARFRQCQWLDGDGPFTEADKCGRPVWRASSPYCRDHARQAVDRRQTTAMEADASDG